MTTITALRQEIRCFGLVIIERKHYTNPDWRLWITFEVEQ